MKCMLRSSRGKLSVRSWTWLWMTWLHCSHSISFFCFSFLSKCLPVCKTYNASHFSFKLYLCYTALFCLSKYSCKLVSLSSSVINLLKLSLSFESCLLSLLSSIYQSCHGKKSISFQKNVIFHHSIFFDFGAKVDF